MIIVEVGYKWQLQNELKTAGVIQIFIKVMPSNELYLLCPAGIVTKSWKDYCLNIYVET